MGNCHNCLVRLCAGTVTALALCLTVGLAHAQDMASISGAVLDEAGAGIARAEVTVSGKTLAAEHKTTTDPSGKYSLNGLPPGTYTLTVSASQFKTFEDKSVTISAGATLKKDVVLRVGKLGIYDTFGYAVAAGQNGEGVLSGIVADKAENAPIPYAFVYIHGGYRKAQVDTPVPIDKAGQFRISLAPGLYDVFVAAAGFAPTCTVVEVRSGEVTRFDPRLGPDTEHSEQ